MISRVSETDTIKVLYELWQDNHMGVLDIKHILLVKHNLNLISLTNCEVIVESLDKKVKYLIK